jgi:hypothetical protein
MHKKIFKKIISSSILVGLIFPAFLISTTPKKVNAQLDPYNFLGTSTDIVSDVANIVTSIRGCTKDDQKEIKKDILKNLMLSSAGISSDSTNILSAVESLGGDLGIDVSSYTDYATNYATQIGNNAINQIGSNLGLGDNLSGTLSGLGISFGGSSGSGEPTDPEKLDETTQTDTATKYEVNKKNADDKDIKDLSDVASTKSDDNVPIVNTELLAETKAVKDAVVKAKKKETCYDKVAYVVSRMILKNNVKKTINWITNGNYGGDPLYLTDAES